MSKKLLLIMNPFSGRKLANKYLADIILLFSKNGYETICFMTTGVGNATEISQNYAKEVDRIVCIGGDGTFNEVVSGVLKANATTPIGYIPSGSTNDFASSLNLSKNILTAANDIMCGKIESFDVGKFNDRYFSYVASFGAFTKTSYNTPQYVKNALGHLAYVLEGTKSIGTIKSEHLKITTDDEVIEDDFIFGAFSNSTSVGGILTLDKSVVDMHDGIFEIILVKAPKNLIDLTECLIALTNKKYENSNMIIFKSTTKASIQSPDGIDWTLDGEFFPGIENIEFENIHNGINLIVNK